LQLINMPLVTQEWAAGTLNHFPKTKIQTACWS